MNLTERDTELQHQRLTLIRYLEMKTDAEDWHAVADAAMDLRELDTKMACYGLKPAFVQPR